MVGGERQLLKVPFDRTCTIGWLHLGEMGAKYLERERKELEGGELCPRNGKDKQRVL